MRAVERSAVHNLVVCTLCSCYPWPVLGLPPVWYKSSAYRSRAVSEPRAVLAEFGTVLGPEVDVRVWDSTAELRYLVIPERPAGTEPGRRSPGGPGLPRRHGGNGPAVNGVHDMGGMHGFGPVLPEPEGSPFHAAWEGRVHAMVIASPTRGNIDAGRHRRELIPPADYLAMSYYERWLAALVAMLGAGGFVSPAELASGAADPAAAKATPRLRAADVAGGGWRRRRAYPRLATKTAQGRRIQVNDKVRSSEPQPASGHTRLPRYARGKAGVVEAHHGAHVFPCGVLAHGHSRRGSARPLLVRFTTPRELWGARPRPPATASASTSGSPILNVPEAPPVFEEPWQAQAFALAVHLNARGAFGWDEWATALAAELARDPGDDGSRYYHHWVAALETLTAERGLAAWSELTGRKTAWAEAYRQTTHGKPVEL